MLKFTANLSRKRNASTSDSTIYILLTFLTFNPRKNGEIWTISKIIQHIVYSHFSVALSGSILVLGISAFEFNKLSFAYPIFVFFAVLSLYIFQRLYKFYDGQLTNNLNAWVIEHKRSLLIFGLFGLLASVFILFTQTRINAEIITILIASGLISLWYVMPVFNLKLRDIPYLKGPIVAIIWSVVIVYLPLVMYGSEKAYQLTLLFTLYFLALAIPFDIKDVHHDPKAQKTIPQIAGIKDAKLLSICIMVLFHLMFCFLYPDFLNNFLFWIELIAFTILVWIIKTDSSVLHYASLDFTMSLFGLCLLLEA